MPFGDSILLQTGECDNRPKRAVMQQDDTVDDQDAIPAFNPTVTSVNLTLTWHTAHVYFYTGCLKKSIGV